MSGAPYRPPARLPRSFEPEASVVLIGIRGTGKSTLAVFASSAFQWRLVDADYAFHEATGLTHAEYKQRHGAHDYRARQLGVLQSVLHANPKRCVLVCGSSSGALEKTGQELLRDYARSHPVVYVVRDPKSLQGYLKDWQLDRITTILNHSGSVFRSCSNFEFYNLTEPKVNAEPSALRPALSAPTFLTLNHLERHFLKFITLVTSGAGIPSLESAYPLSQIRPEFRRYTYGMAVPLSAFVNHDLDVEELESGADVFELIVDDLTSPAKFEQFSCSRADQISDAFSRIRRGIIVPLLYHVRPGLAMDSEEAKTIYLDLIFHGLRLAPEYMSLDLSLDDNTFNEIVRMKGSTRIIGHLFVRGDHPPPWDSPSWIRSYERAKWLGCDIVRFLRPAFALEDNYAAQRFRDTVSNLPSPRPPVIAYNTGEMGRFSACFNPVLVPVTHPILQALEAPKPIIASVGGGHERSVPPPDVLRTFVRPCVTAASCTNALFSAFVYSPLRFYVVGDAAHKNPCPPMHEVAFQSCGMPHTCSWHQERNIEKLKELAGGSYFGGFSINDSLAIDTTSLSNLWSPHAKAVGAIDTIVPIRASSRASEPLGDLLDLMDTRNQPGPVKALYGDNTTWLGVRACIRRGLSPANAVTSRTSALIVGAGSTARAAAYAVLQLGVKNLFILNKHTEDSEGVVAHFQRLSSTFSHETNGDSTKGTNPLGSTAEFHILESWDTPWPVDFRQPTIIVSCISSSDCLATLLPSQWLKSATGAVVLDATEYTPPSSSVSVLAKQIQSEAHRGYISMGASDLMPEVGFAQFELFTGRRAPRNVMRREVRQRYIEIERACSDGNSYPSR
ncbi:type I 3-dehydroquinase-domain-containing protein [Lineolata rhizophorae]|uniref:Type I 3-dehydroquinase-domain-containing protein n=1 Tax=Lineolata rhizophorae TaxID=578093 RepID=A0A6A6P7L8_9PEZI|nr:type I 3-dehydroquinase-domain-containing protein [Lineolata rhizophorae]